MAARLPRIVIRRERLALRDRRVSIGPEDNERRRVRILERLFPQPLERLGVYFLGVGNDAMHHLDSENIRLVLL